MNPKGPTDLDPKLKETYERIMGTSFATAQQPVQPVQQGPIGQPTQAMASVQAPQQPKEQPKPVQPVFTTTQVAEPPPLPTPEVKNLTPEMVQSPVFNAGNPFSNTPPLQQNRVFAKNEINGATPAQQHKKNKLMPIILTLGGVVFFVVYTIIWAKVFGVI